MITIEHDHDDYLVCRIAGTLTKTDYDAAVPELEHALRLRRGDLKLMIILEDFRGWDAEGLWEELKFDFRHRKDFSRIAVLGENALEKWGTLLSKPFFAADMRFFRLDERAAAQSWLAESGPGDRPAAAED